MSQEVVRHVGRRWNGGGGGTSIREFGTGDKDMRPTCRDASNFFSTATEAGQSWCVIGFDGPFLPLVIVRLFPPLTLSPSVPLRTSVALRL